MGTLVMLLLISYVIISGAMVIIVFTSLLLKWLSKILT